MKKFKTMCRVLFPNSSDDPPIFFKVFLVNSTAEFFAATGSIPKSVKVLSIKSFWAIDCMDCSIDSTEIFFVSSMASLVNREVTKIRGRIITSTTESRERREEVFFLFFVQTMNFL